MQIKNIIYKAAMKKKLKRKMWDHEREDFPKCYPMAKNIGQYDD